MQTTPVRSLGTKHFHSCVYLCTRTLPRLDWKTRSLEVSGVITRTDQRWLHFPTFVEFFETSKMFHGLRIPSGRWRSSFPEVSRERDSEKRRQISLRRLRRGNNHSCRCIFLFLFFFFSYRGGDACDEYKKWRRRGRRRKRMALKFPLSFFLSFFLSLSLSLSRSVLWKCNLWREGGGGGRGGRGGTKKS